MGASLSRAEPDLAPDVLSEKLGSQLSHVEQLGGGQFLKSIKCMNEDGVLVVKIYTKRDPTPLPDYYKDLLAEVRQRLTLNGAPNVMPFRC